MATLQQPTLEHDISTEHETTLTSQDPTSPEQQPEQTTTEEGPSSSSSIVGATQCLDDIAGEVLTYWFGIEYWRRSEPPNPTSFYDDLWRSKWFAKEELTKKVDDLIRTNFEEHIRKASEGSYDHWTNSAQGCLALIILLDQFTRNVYRNSARAWSGDAKALQVCLMAIEKGFDKELRPVGRGMLYMPLLHAEDAQLQAKSQEMFNQLYLHTKASCPGFLQIAERFTKIAQIHAKSVELFGRFPERNQYLGRKSTVAEEAYLRISAVADSKNFFFWRLWDRAVCGYQTVSPLFQALVDLFEFLNFVLTLDLASASISMAFSCWAPFWTCFSA